MKTPKEFRDDFKDSIATATEVAIAFAGDGMARTRPATDISTLTSSTAARLSTMHGIVTGAIATEHDQDFLSTSYFDLHVSDLINRVVEFSSDMGQTDIDRVMDNTLRTMANHMRDRGYVFLAGEELEGKITSAYGFAHVVPIALEEDIAAVKGSVKAYVTEHWPDDLEFMKIFGSADGAVEISCQIIADNAHHLRRFQPMLSRGAGTYAAEAPEALPQKRLREEEFRADMAVLLRANAVVNEEYIAIVTDAYINGLQEQGYTFYHGPEKIDFSADLQAAFEDALNRIANTPATAFPELDGVPQAQWDAVLEQLRAETQNHLHTCDALLTWKAIKDTHATLAQKLAERVEHIALVQPAAGYNAWVNIMKIQTKSL